MILNRLSGKPTNNLTTIAGAYIFEGDGQLNGIEVDSPAYLLPDRNDAIRVSSGALKIPLRFTEVPFSQLPDKDLRESLRLIGKRLADLENTQAGWWEWAKVSPLILDAQPELVSLNDFERAIIAYLWHLEQVNRSPHSWLTLEIERLPVSRARRIPSRAYGYLASHTEDWEYRTLTSVVPRRVLSVMAEELLDFYENRLAVHLINDLYRYLAARLERLLQLREDREIEQETGTHFRRLRVYGLWGQAITREQASERIKPTLEAIEGLYRRVRTMFDDTLCRAIPEKSWALVPATVRHTNLLVHDRHYRFVSILWEKWLSSPHYSKPKTELQTNLELQETARAFDRYCMLLVVRGLKQLGFEPVRASKWPSETMYLEGPVGRINVTWNRTLMTIRCEGEGFNLHIVPILSRLARAGTADEVKSRINALEHMAEDSETLIILYPGTRAEIEQHSPTLQLRLNSVGMFGMKFALLPVSPYELGVVERLARALRWTLWRSLYCSYPPKIEFPVKYWDDLRDLVHDWGRLASTEGHHLIVTRCPSDRERADLFGKLHDLQGKARSKGRQGRRDVDLLSQFKGSLEELLGEQGLFGRLLRCPIGGCDGASRGIELRDDDTFECTCACGCRWGIRKCTNCDQKYPYLENPQGEFSPGKVNWVDLTYGMDILAVPCQWGNYICPSCGICPELAAREPETCRACPAYLVGGVT